MNKQQKIEQLEHQIEKLKAEIGNLDNWQAKVYPLDSFSPGEKIEIFDKLYKQAWEYLDELVREEFYPKDGDHYIYEAVMTEMLGPLVWEIIRSVIS
jgi:hypothetical protein